jgi:hypothetical protein
MRGIGDWGAVLKGNPVDWLLGDDDPSVRYFVLTEILDMDGGDALVREAKDEIMRTGAVPAILDRQNSEGYWETPERFYTAKYRGTVWQLIILAALGADGGDERIKRACEWILENSQDPDSGGFSQASNAGTSGGRHSGVIPCLTGNLVWSLIRFGYLEDPRVQRGINWITRYQRFDDGIENVPKGWPYDRYEMCWGKHTCHMGVVKALKALAELPENKRSDAVKATIEKGAEYLLSHHVYKRSHDLARVSRPSWRRFEFPLMYQTDVLEVLDILTNLGYGDERMREAVDLVESKQDDSGRWRLERTFNGRFQVDIEEKGKPSRWITQRALRVLKRYHTQDSVIGQDQS